MMAKRCCFLAVAALLLQSLNHLSCLLQYSLQSPSLTQMCGSETTTKPRGGALAALWPPRDTLTPLAALRGDLAFYTPGNPGSTLATHVRLMQAEGSNTLSQNLHVTIQ